MWNWIIRDNWRVKWNQFDCLIDVVCHKSKCYDRNDKRNLNLFERIESSKYSKLETDDRRWKFELIESYYKWFEIHFLDNIHFIDHNFQCDRNRLPIYALMKKTCQIECRINSINKLNCSTTWLNDCRRLIIDRLQKISTRADLKKKLSKWSCLNEKKIDWDLRKIFCVSASTLLFELFCKVDETTSSSVFDFSTTRNRNW